ncbi:MAG TPA: helix-turn-helix transcriptional regulator [Gemmataceae bacterium]
MSRSAFTGLPRSPDQRDQARGGHSNKETAVQLRLSVKTVEIYKAWAMEKFGMHTHAEVVRYACARDGWKRTKRVVEVGDEGIEPPIFRV